MATILTQTKKILLNPGFGAHLVSFLPMIQATQNELSRLSSFEQRKLRFKILHKSCLRALESTLGFWVGCMMWCVYLNKKFKTEPQTIICDDFLNIKKEDILNYTNVEFSVMEKYIETYSKNVMYYTGERDFLPDFYIKILNEYRGFIKTNNYFLEAQKTQDIKIPNKIEGLTQYNEQELEYLHLKIMHIIDKGNLSEFLDTHFAKNL